jgi:type I restriction enzyme S subunit
MSEHGNTNSDVAVSLPTGWVATTLGEAIQPERPRGLPADYKGSPFVGLEHIEPHTTQLLGSVPAETMRSSGVCFAEGDVLYGRMRPYLNKVWLADRAGLCSGEFIVFPGTGAFHGGFLRYRLNAQDFVGFADHTTTGDRPRADFADLGRFAVLLPPLAEQERIADRIDELFTDLSAGAAALERVRKKLRRYRSAVLHAAVTGRLTAEWRKTHGPPAEPGDKLLARILIERRKQWEQRTLAKYAKDGRTPPKNWQARYVEPAGPNATNLPELPAGWCWASGDYLIQVLRSGTTAVPIDKPAPRCILRSSAVRPGRIDLQDFRYLPDDVHIDVEDYVRPNDLFFVRLSGSLHLALKQASPSRIIAAVA